MNFVINLSVCPKNLKILAECCQLYPETKINLNVCTKKYFGMIGGFGWKNVNFLRAYTRVFREMMKRTTENKKHYWKKFLCVRYKYFSRKGRDNGINLSTKRKPIILAVVLLISFIVRILLFPLQGYPIDTNDFIAWFGTAAQHGVRPFYDVAGFADYPPFNVYIFWLFGSLANAFSISMATMVKIVPNIFDLGTALLIYLFVRKQTTIKLSILSVALYAFNPAVIHNTAVWGQFDSVYTFFLILSLILALKSKPLPSAAVFAIGLLTKPQAIALLPLVAFLIYKKNGLKTLLISILVFSATIFLVILPFQWSNPITFLSKIYFGAYGGYAYTSINAFNLWALYGLWAPDGNFFILGWILFGAFAVFVLYFLHKRFEVSGEMIGIFGAFMLFFTFFMLPTRIHERYLFPAMSTLALMFPFFKKTRLLYAVLTATFLINQAYVLYWLNAYYPNAGPNLTGDPVVVAVSVINLLMLAYASILMWYELRGRGWLKTEPVELSQSQEGDQNETEPADK
jgi:dolichyl-phosphate-mannose-protein mannosyltransferase